MLPLGTLSLLALAAAAPATLIDSASLAVFAEREIPTLLEKHDLAGMVVTFVKDGQVVFSGGYGYQDVERGIPVDPERTLFRAGSISKLFVWTAVMQCVERGLVDLDVDVNRYLEDFQLPATHPEPITLRHLMSHTPGFEDQMLGLFEKDLLRVRTLAQGMRAIPRRVAPPGRLVSYSNYGAALAAYVVEQVTGTPFDRYVDERILEPLGMTRTTFAQPLPRSLAADLAVGYAGRGTARRPQGFEYVSGLYPAGSLSTTAADLARFLLAHLGRGSSNGRQILAPATADEMHSRDFALAPDFSGTAHGFLYTTSGGGPVLYHGGDTLFFHSLAGIIPEQRFGFFVSTNSDAGALAIVELARRLFAQFVPGEPGETLAREQGELEPAERFSGLYLSERHSESDLTRLTMLAMQVRVRPAPEGGLLVTSFMHPGPERYVQVGDGLFQQAKGGERLLFLEDETGAVRSLVLGMVPIMTFTRPALADHPLLTAVLALGGLLLVLTGLVLPPTGVVALLGRHRSTGEARTAARVGALLVASFVAYSVTLVAAFSGEPLDLLALSPGKQVAPFIPYLSLPLAVAVALLAVRAWRRGYWGVSRRVHYSALAVGAVALLWLLFHWKMAA